MNRRKFIKVATSAVVGVAIVPESTACRSSHNTKSSLRFKVCDVVETYGGTILRINSIGDNIGVHEYGINFLTKDGVSSTPDSIKKYPVEKDWIWSSSYEEDDKNIKGLYTGPKFWENERIK